MIFAVLVLISLGHLFVSFIHLFGNAGVYVIKSVELVLTNLLYLRLFFLFLSFRTFLSFFLAWTFLMLSLFLMTFFLAFFLVIMLFFILLRAQSIFWSQLQLVIRVRLRKMMFKDMPLGFLLLQKLCEVCKFLFLLLLLLLLLLSLVRVTIEVLSSIDGLLDLLVTHLLNRFGHIALCLEQSVHEIVLKVLLLQVLDGYNQSHQN